MNEVSGVSDATAINLSSEKDDWNEWKRDEKSESWTGVSLPFPHFFLAIPDLRSAAKTTLTNFELRKVNDFFSMFFVCET